MGWAQTTVLLADFGEPSLEYLLSRTLIGLNKYFKRKLDYVTRAISQSGLEEIWERMLREDIKETYLIFIPYGGTMSRIPETTILFPQQKGTIFKIQYLVY
ncbi:Berberine bridge enzyme-like 4 [Linum grandiflorum]